MGFWSSLLAIFKPAPKPARLVAPCLSSVAFTGSMYPLFKGGETIWIEYRPFESIREGFLVVAWWEGRGLNVLHEVVAVRVAANHEPYLITKGTANNWRDEHVCTRENYVGFVQRPNPDAA